MKYEWPIINTIDDILPAIKGRDEFIIAERDWGTVVNYQVNYIDTFPRPNTKDDELNVHYALRRECRGIKFDLDGKIIARVFHKFFNLNERPETMSNNIDWTKPFDILNKLDGSMIHPILVDGDILWCTKMGLTDVSAQAAEFVKLNPKYERFARDMLNEDVTLMFEWCSRQQRIVIDYEHDNLILLAMRVNVHGYYFPIGSVEYSGMKYRIPVVKKFGDNFNNITDFVDDVTTRQQEEGYVLRFKDGHCVKVKNLWYVQLHKVKELLNFEKDVISIVINNTYDDVKAFMEDDDKDRLDRFADDLLNNMSATAERLMWIVIALRDNVGDSQKKFAALVLREHKDVSGLLFNIDNGKDPYDTVVALVLKNLGSSTKVNNIRHLIGDIHWKDY